MNMSRVSARSRAGMLHLVPPCEQEPSAGVRAARTSLRRYSVWAVAAYNAITVVHYLFGATAVIIAYPRQPAFSWPFALAYLLFSVIQFYLLMPATVCPGCVYRTVPGSRCVSGLNVLSAILRPRAGNVREFQERSRGLGCHNAFLLAAFGLPVVVVLPGLVLFFSWTALAFWLALASLLVVRVEVILRHAGCPHCLARRWCPNAKALKIV